MSGYRGPSPEELARRSAEESAEIARFPETMRRASRIAVGKALTLSAALAVMLLADFLVLLWVWRTISFLAGYLVMPILFFVGVHAFVRLARWLGDRNLVALLTLRRDANHAFVVSAPEARLRARVAQEDDARAEALAILDAADPQALDHELRSARNA